MAKTPPCKKNGIDCPRRCPGCQDECEDLIPLREHYAAIRKARAEERIYLSYAIPIIIRNRDK